MPDGYRPAEPINVAILSAEDGASDTIVPRLIVAGANLARVFIIGGIVNDIGIERSWVLPDDMLELSRVRESERDPVAHHRPTKRVPKRGRRHSPRRRGKRDASPVGEHGRRARLRGAGRPSPSQGRRDRCQGRGLGFDRLHRGRSVEWAAGTDPDDATRFVLAVSKINIAAKPQSLVYRITQNEEYDTNRIRWEGGSNITASDLTGERQSDEERSALDEAKAFLLEVLRDGPVPTNDVSQQAKAAGIEAASLKRARKRLGVTSRKTAAGPWELGLPTEGEREPTEGERARHALLPLLPLLPLPLFPGQRVCVMKISLARVTKAGKAGKAGSPWMAAPLP